MKMVSLVLVTTEVAVAEIEPMTPMDEATETTTRLSPHPIDSKNIQLL